MKYGSIRFAYQAPGLLRSTWLALSGRTTETWIEDHTTGERVLLKDRDNALLTVLRNHLRANDVNDPAVIERTFERVANAIHQAQRGDAPDYSLLLTWQEHDWDDWIRSLVKRGA
jgi:hypothetical protein